MDSDFNYGRGDNFNQGMLGLIDEGDASKIQQSDPQYGTSANGFFDLSSVSLAGGSLPTGRSMPHSSTARNERTFSNSRDSASALYDFGGSNANSAGNGNGDSSGVSSWNSSLFYLPADKGKEASSPDPTGGLMGVIGGFDGSSNNSYRSEFSVGGLIGSSGSTTSAGGSSLSTSPLVTGRSCATAPIPPSNQPITANAQQRGVFEPMFAPLPPQSFAQQQAQQQQFGSHRAHGIPPSPIYETNALLDNHSSLQNHQQVALSNNMTGSMMPQQQQSSYPHHKYGSRGGTSPLPLGSHGGSDLVMSASVTPHANQQMNLYQQQQQQQQLQYYQPQQQHSYRQQFRHQHTPGGNVTPKGNSAGYSRGHNGHNGQHMIGAGSGHAMSHPSSGTGGSNAQGRAINKMLLEILRERTIDPQRLDLAIDTYVERMDCVNLATLLFHTGKKRMLLIPGYIKRIAARFSAIKEELRAREASNALYGLKCMSSEIPEVRELVASLAQKLLSSTSEFVAQAVGNALYGMQMMTSEYEEVRMLLHVLAIKVSSCTELLEAQNVGNALYGLRGMSSDWKEVRAVVTALTPKIATAREDLNGQALGNSLYGLQSMSSKEAEVRFLLAVLATKVTRTWEDLKAQEVGNALYGLKRMSSEVAEVRILVSALVPKVATSPEILDAQAIGNSFYGLQNMRSDNPEVLSLLAVMADKVAVSCPELDGQAMGNSLYGLQGMSSNFAEVRAVIAALTTKIQASCLDMNAQELGNALFGIQLMSSEHFEVRQLLTALTQKAISSKYELTSQEIGNAIFGLQGMSSNCAETRVMVRQMAIKIQQSHAVLDPQAVSNCLFGLRRLSSDSGDVRLLLQAITAKVDHFWKLLSAQHVASALFGLQGQCSAEVEVRALIKALLPKILSCRDEMSASQLAHALFGLRGMSSDHVEVTQLLGALSEKMDQSTDASWNLELLAMALSGLQGMNSNHDAVCTLLGHIAQKAEAVSFDEQQKVEPNHIANCIFGMQRMRSEQPSVQRLLSVLATLFSKILPSHAVDWKACSNIVFGLNGCRIEDDSVQKLLKGVLERMREMVTPTASATSILVMYQATVLAAHRMGELSRETTATSGTESDDTSDLSDLRDVLSAALRDFEGAVSSLDGDAPSLSAAEERMTLELSDILLCAPTTNASASLNNSPFTLRTRTLLHGFHAAAVVQLAAGTPELHTEPARGDCRAWAPVLNLELRGSSYNSPAKEWFYALRQSYLQEVCKVSVMTLPAESFRMDGQQGMKLHAASALSVLFPPTPEDATAFEARLAEKDTSTVQSGARRVLLSDVLSSICNAAPDTPGLSFFADPSHLRNSRMDRMVPEYLDDDIDLSNGAAGAASSAPREQHAVLGMLLATWLGPLPCVDTLTAGAHYATLPPATASAAGHLQESASHSAVKSATQSPKVWRSASRDSAADCTELAAGAAARGVAQGAPVAGALTFPGNAPIPGPIKTSEALPETGYASSEAYSTGTVTPQLKVSPLSAVLSEDATDKQEEPQQQAQTAVDQSEVDEEIAALEAQLEVARLEARIKMLKSKKFQQQQQQQQPPAG